MTQQSIECGVYIAHMYDRESTPYLIYIYNYDGQKYYTKYRYKYSTYVVEWNPDYSIDTRPEEHSWQAVGLEVWMLAMMKGVWE